MRYASRGERHHSIPLGEAAWPNRPLVCCRPCLSLLMEPSGYGSPQEDPDFEPNSALCIASLERRSSFLQRRCNSMICLPTPCSFARETRAIASILSWRGAWRSSRGWTPMRKGCSIVRGPGDFIGEMSFLLPSGLRTASVRTRTHVELLGNDSRDLQPTLAAMAGSRRGDGPDAESQAARFGQRQNSGDARGVGAQVSKVLSELQSDS